jgi:hypothetical protein
LTIDFIRVEYRVSQTSFAEGMAMDGVQRKGCVAFEGTRRIASGDPAQVASKAKQAFDRGRSSAILIFDDVTGEQVDIDFSGSPEEVSMRLRARGIFSAEPPQEEPAPRGPGRPRLGVVAHEVTLLPRHWEWLAEQPGGASVTLRKLVDEARRVNEGKDRVRRSREAAYRFLSAMAGNLPDFEEATRALFAGDGGRFHELTERWPVGICELGRKLAAEGLEISAVAGV